MVANISKKIKLNKNSLETLLCNAYAFAIGESVYLLDINSEDNDEDYFVLSEGFNEAFRYSYYGAEYRDSSLFLLPEYCDTPMEFTILSITNVKELL